MTTDREGERERETWRKRKKERESKFHPLQLRTLSQIWEWCIIKCRRGRNKGEGGGRGVVMQSVVQEEKTKGVKWKRGKTAEAEKHRSVAETRPKDQKMDWREEKKIKRWKRISSARRLPDSMFNRDVHRKALTERKKCPFCALVCCYGVNTILWKPKNWKNDFL